MLGIALVESRAFRVVFRSGMLRGFRALEVRVCVDVSLRGLSGFGSIFSRGGRSRFKRNGVCTTSDGVWGVGGVEWNLRAVVASR